MERNKREIRQAEMVTKTPIPFWNYGNLPEAYMPASEAGVVGQNYMLLPNQEVKLYVSRC